MRQKIFGIVILCISFFLSSSITHAQSQQWNITSPDDSVVVTVALSAQGQLTYEVRKQNQLALEASSLGLTTSSQNFTTGLSFVSQTPETINQTYSLKSGKKSSVTVNANQLTLRFTNANNQAIDMVFYADNQGVAYRYKLNGSGSYDISSEVSSFRVPSSSTIYAQNWTSNYENVHNKLSPQALSGNYYGMPVLVETSSNWLLISEADINGGYATSRLLGDTTTPGLLKTAYPPDEALPISGTLPFASPWRVIVVGELSTIVESTLTTDLSSPNKLANDSWVKPGRVAWSWWSDGQSPKSLQIQKDYVDFAAEMGWEYILVDEGWSDSWLNELIAYGNSKNVKIIIWKIWGVSAAEFQAYKQRGVAGFKLDFLDSDSQARMGYYDQAAQATAEQQLIVNFHGSTKSNGEIRTWPQFLTREGVHGGEHRSSKAAFDVPLIYTRNAAGPMDFTPVLFSQRNTTSVAYQLATAVLFESGLQHFADSKESYRASPAKPFLQNVPVAWDDTKFIDGRPLHYATIARRKGNDW